MTTSKERKKLFKNEAKKKDDSIIRDMETSSTMELKTKKILF